MHEHIRISDFGNLHFNLWNPEKLWLNILFLLVELAALLVCLLYFRVYRDEASIMSLGFLSPTKETVGIGALLGLLVPSIWFLVVYISADAFVLSTNGISLLYLFQLIIVFILVAVVEEGLFRGYILNTLLKVFSPLVSVVITSTMFALMHVSNPHMTFHELLVIFLLGCLASQFFLYTKKLWMSMAFHLTWNLSIVVSFYLLNEDPLDELQQNGFNLMNSSSFLWLLTLILSLLIIILAFIIHKKEAKTRETSSSNDSRFSAA